MLIESKWIEGLVTFPLYLATVFILNGIFKLEALWYVVTFLILLYVFAYLYRIAVVNRVRNGVSTWLILGQWLVGQFLIIISVWYFGSITISSIT